MRNVRWIGFFICLLRLGSMALQASDWPCYQGNAERSGVTSESLAFPLSPAWRYDAARPQPAWPEPGRTMHLMDFDYAVQPVVAGSLVFFGSSADDTVRAIDAKTGQERWRCVTGAPVRFAPHIADGRCYVAGDDGYVRCLEAETGKPVWSVRVAPNGRQALGNGRMISRSPCRSGVLVADGVAYVTSGMWPNEGVAVYALDAATGKTIWCNDTSNSLYLPHPHGSASFGGPAPQGYLLASGDVLVVPTGQASPAGFDRKTGKLLYCNMTFGGSWATIAGDVFFTHRIRAVNADRDIVHLGESGPVEGDGVEARNVRTGEAKWESAESYRALDKKGNPPGEVVKHGLTNRNLVVWNNRTLYALGGGVVEALDCSNPTAVKRLWSVPHPRAYSVAMAGDTLLIGGAGTITALRTGDGKEIWSTKTDGQVRGMAVANGQLLAATETGAIHCYGATGGSLAAPGTAAPAKSSGAADAVMAQLTDADRLKGYALVIGEPDARLAEDLAVRTQLHVVCALGDTEKVNSERLRLVEQTNLYGRRIAVQHLPAGERLPFGPYFANVVVVSSNAGGVKAADLYSVLRPCGGQMVFTASAQERAAQIIDVANIPAGEVQAATRKVTRGKLEGAFDWDSEVKSDQRVRWPLELLWFGGPGPDRMLARHWKSPTPVFAHGRYIAIGQYHIIAVDAYNGCELWSRQTGGNVGYRVQKIVANDQRVYVNYADFTVEFDVQTGKLLKLYGVLKPSPCFELKEPQEVPLAYLGNKLGSVRISRTPEALELLVAQDVPDGPPNDLWQLHFDFRPLARQFTDEGHGAFRIRLTPADGAYQPGLGGPLPKLTVTRQQAEAGHRVLIRIPLDGVRELLGAEPAMFRFAATIQHEEPRVPPQKADAFVDGSATFANDGWATFVIDESKAQPKSEWAVPVAVGKLDDLPTYTRDWPKQPPQYTADWTINLYDKLELRSWPPADRDPATAKRTNPLTGNEEWRSCSKSHGCGGVVESATMEFFRSGTIGIFDRLGDSGLRNFSAIRPGCGTTIIPAGGLMISSEGQADCTCPFNFQTSFAMVPVTARRNEDWALFDAPMTASLIRGAALNLGAPGDRRDDQGTLWLGTPRQPLALGQYGSDAKKRGRRYAVGVPCELEYFGSFGTYYQNADRNPPGGTERPWIYASGARGLKKATLNLLYGENETVLAPRTLQTVKVDGTLDESGWNGIAPETVNGQKTTLYVRHDDVNLYLGAKRSGGAKADQPVLQMTLRQDGAPKFARLEIMPDGTHRSIRWACVADIPRLPQITIDGAVEDWDDRGYKLRLPGGATARLGWTEEGLAMLMDAPKDFKVQNPENTGLMALVVQPRMYSFLQMALDAKTQAHVLDQRLRDLAEVPNPPVNKNVSGLMHWNKSYGKLFDPPSNFKAEAVRSEKTTVVETLFPWSALTVKPEVGQEVAFQIAFYDPAKVDPKFAKGGDWRSQVLAESRTLLRLRLSEKPGTGDEVGAAGNQRFGLGMPGVIKRDAAWEPAWTSNFRAEGNDVVVEAEIPWSVLQDAGLEKDRLMVSFEDGMQMEGPAPQVSQTFDQSARRFVWEKPVSRSRPYTVRLHFCEPDEVAPGQRVFDVKLQGKVVLSGLDIVAAAGKPKTALVKEFPGVEAEQSIAIELVPKSGDLSERTVPVLNGIEVMQAE